MKYIALLLMAMLAVINMAMQFIATCFAIVIGAVFAVAYCLVTILYPSKD